MNKELNSLKKCITNSPDFPENHFAVIIGTSPSKGARSPILWNAVYEALGSKIRMVPLDVDQTNLVSVLKSLEHNTSFIGGAVTAPYKEEILNVDLEYDISFSDTNLISSNCIFRDYKRGKLVACNTDIEAAIDCLKSTIGSLDNKTVAILGFGGVGKPLALKLSELNVECAVFKRNVADLVNFSFPFQMLDWSAMPNSLYNFDVIINATTIGFSVDGSRNDQSPLHENIINLLSPETFIYDLIYSKNPTKLSETAQNAGLRFMDGSCMNLNQAILGFLKCNTNLSCEEAFVREIMERVKNEQGW